MTAFSKPLGDSTTNPLKNPAITRASTLVLIASFLFAVSTLSLPQGSANGPRISNILIVFDSDPSHWTYVTAPAAAAQFSNQSTIACVQPVKITFNVTGDFVTLVGAAPTSSGTCTPCTAYDPASTAVACTPITFGGTGPIFMSTDPTTTIKTNVGYTLGCITPVQILVDADGDGNPDAGVSHLLAFDPNCPETGA